MGEIPGLTDNTIPRRLGPKRASKIRKLFNLSKEDDVCQYVIKRPLPLKDGKKQKFAAPKVQRLVTPVMLQRDTGSLSRGGGERRIGWLLLSTPRFWLRGRRKLRRPRSSRGRGLPLFVSPRGLCQASSRAPIVILTLQWMQSTLLVPKDN